MKNDVFPLPVFPTISVNLPRGIDKLFIVRLFILSEVILNFPVIDKTGESSHFLFISKFSIFFSEFDFGKFSLSFVVSSRGFDDGLSSDILSLFWGKKIII